MISGKLLLGPFLASGLASGVATTPVAVEGDSVLSLRQAGWVIVEKSVRDEKHPAVAPYLSISRIINVTTWVLKKGDYHRTCTIARDTVLEKFEQSCGPVLK
jgi:hypothetical protein